MKILEPYLRVVVFALALIALNACSARIHEQHYFATVAEGNLGKSPTGDSEIINIFRLDIRAGGSFSNIRYIAGNYDERAVDFFFNEVHSENYTPNLSGPTKIFDPNCPDKGKDGIAMSEEECQAYYKKSLKLYPLVSGGDGSTPTKPLKGFVIILSSNAEAIAETIGAFSESTIAIQSMNYLLNKDTFEEEARVKAVEATVNSERAAVSKSLKGHFDSFVAQNATDTIGELAILQSLAVALAPEDAISFTDIGEAKLWFTTRK